MKSTSPRFVSLILVASGLAFASFAGCSKQDRDDASAKAKDAVADTKDAMSNTWDKVKSATFDKRDDFSAQVKAMSSKLDAQLAQARADYSDDKASASRKAAMAELKDSEADYKAKADALGSATADTWDSAKQNVIAAWDRVEASYNKARAN